MEGLGSWTREGWAQALTTRDQDQIKRQMGKVADPLKGKEAILGILKQEKAISEKPQLLIRLFRLFPNNEKLRLSSIIADVAAKTFEKELSQLSEEEKKEWFATALEAGDQESVARLLETGWLPPAEWLHTELLKVDEGERAACAKTLAAVSPQFVCKYFQGFQLSDEACLREVFRALASSGQWASGTSFSASFPQLGIKSHESAFLAAKYAASLDPSIFDHVAVYQPSEEELKAILGVVAEYQPTVFLDNLSRFSGDENQEFVNELLLQAALGAKTLSYFLEGGRSTPFLKEKIKFLAQAFSRSPYRVEQLIQHFPEFHLEGQELLEVVENCLECLDLRDVPRFMAQLYMQPLSPEDERAIAQLVEKNFPGHGKKAMVVKAAASSDLTHLLSKWELNASERLAVAEVHAIAFPEVFRRDFAKYQISEKELGQLISRQGNTIPDDFDLYALSSHTRKEILRAVAKQQPRVFLDKLALLEKDENQNLIDDLLASTVQNSEDFNFFIEKKNNTPYVQDKMVSLAKKIRPEKQKLILNKLLEFNLINAEKCLKLIQGCFDLEDVSDELSKKAELLFAKILHLEEKEKQKILKSIRVLISESSGKIFTDPFFFEGLSEILDLDKNSCVLSKEIFFSFYRRVLKKSSPEEAEEMKRLFEALKKYEKKLSDPAFAKAFLQGVEEIEGGSATVVEELQFYQKVLEEEEIETAILMLKAASDPKIFDSLGSYELNKESRKKILKILACHQPKRFLDALAHFAREEDQKFVNELLLLATGQEKNLFYFLSKEEKTPYLQEKVLWLVENCLTLEGHKYIFDNLSLLHIEGERLFHIVETCVKNLAGKEKVPYNFIGQLNALSLTETQKLTLVSTFLIHRGVPKDFSNQLASLLFTLFKEGEHSNFSNILLFAESTSSKESSLQVKELVEALGKIFQLNSRSRPLALETFLELYPTASALIDPQESVEMVRFVSIIKESGKRFKDKLISVPLLNALKEINKNKQLSSLEKLKFYNGILVGKQVLRDFRNLQALVAANAEDFLKEELVKKKGGPFDLASQIGPQLLKLVGIEKTALPKYEQTFGKDRDPTALLLYASHFQSKGLEGGQKVLESLREFVELVLAGKFEESRYDLTKSEHLTALFEPYPIKLKKWRTQSPPVSLVKGSKELESQEALITWLKGVLSEEDVIPLKTLFEASPAAREKIGKGLLTALQGEIRKQGKLDRDLFPLKFQRALIEFTIAKTTKERAQKLNALMQLGGVKEKRKELYGALQKVEEALPKKESEHSGLTVCITDQRDDLLLSGTEVMGSCQAVDGEAVYNKCLLGTVMNGKTQMVCIKDEQGHLVARRLVRLLWDDLAKLPVLLVDPLYTNRPTDKELDAVLMKCVKERAAELDVKCVLSGKDATGVAYPRQLESLKERAPYEYLDALDREARVASGAEVQFLDNLVEV